MATNKTDDALLAKASKLVGVLGTLAKLPTELRTSGSIDAAATKVRSLAGDLVKARVAYEAALKARDEARHELRSLLSRAQAGVKAVYGEGSAEYEQVGGARVRPPKPRKRTKRAKPAAPNAPQATHATPASPPKPAGPQSPA
jgi:hypothetical protein